MVRTTPRDVRVKKRLLGFIRACSIEPERLNVRTTTRACPRHRTGWQKTPAGRRWSISILHVGPDYSPTPDLNNRKSLTTTTTLWRARGRQGRARPITIHELQHPSAVHTLIIRSALRPLGLRRLLRSADCISAPLK